MEQIDARQEIAFIHKIIQDSRQAVLDNGLDYIVWGLLVSVGMFATFALSYFGVSGNVYLILWLSVMGGGWIFSIARHLRERSAEKTRTLAGSILNLLWLGCGVTIMLFIFIGGPLLQVNPSPAIAAVLGIAYLVSGRLLDFAYFKVSALFWWLGSAAMFILNSPGVYPKIGHQHVDFLLFGMMMLLLQVLPGIILYRRWSRETAGL